MIALQKRSPESTISDYRSQGCFLTKPCVHCGLPTPVHCDTDPSTVFCCNGCKGAYELIQGWGLESFYELRDSSQQNRASLDSDASFDVFDDEEFLGPSKPSVQSDSWLQTRLAIVGLHCAACAWLIENVATRTPGWRSARVKMSNHSIQIVFDPKTIRLSEIARLLNRIGYELAPYIDGDDQAFQIQNRKLLTQIAIAGFCAANAMWIAVALYAGDATGLAASHREFLTFIGTGLGLVSVAIPGRTFFVGAIASLRTRTPHMDLPVALGLSVGSITGIVSVILGRGYVYFDSLAILVFLLLIGRWIQFHQQHRAAKAVDLLLRITPRHARRLNGDGAVTMVLAERLQHGDVVRVFAGESVPADGTIIRGRSLLDRALLTGESRHVRVDVGDSIEAGVVNLQSEFDFRITAIGKDSRIGRVMQSVEEASAGRVPAVQLADRIGGVFVTVVSILAVATFAWWAAVDWYVAASCATALLIVACPCALALATPLAIAVGLGRSAKQKIYIRDGATLGQLAKPGTIWFDKTGTLTEGRPSASLVYGDQDAIVLADAIERGCKHPIAEAIHGLAHRLCLPVRTPGNEIEGHSEIEVADVEVTDVEVGIGGITGHCDGRAILVGNFDFAQSHAIYLDDGTLLAAASCLENRSSPIVIAVDGIAVTVLAVQDTIKPDAAATVSWLANRGWTVGVLSGDHAEIVNQVADQLGISRDHCYGGLSPEDKLRHIKSLQASALNQSSSRRTIVMVGDGANDAAALAAADVGIAVRGGAEVSLRAAPVFIATGQLSTLSSLIDASRRTSALIHTAFATSLAYNLVAVGLAMAGRISPLLAAILMPISSVTVLSLCLVWPIYKNRESQL